MEHTIALTLWKLTDKAQLERFLGKNINKQIDMGEISYRINSGFMENGTNVPHIHLINNDTGELQYVKLSLIDPDYSNYSAIGQASRLDLIAELGIDI